MILFFLNSDIPICKQKADYIPYTNTTAFISGGKADVPKLRCIYKGCTLHYTGNQYNNEGSMTVAPVVIPYEDVATSTAVT